MTRRVTNSLDADPDWAAIEGFLRSHGAADEPHPGGTLLEHLQRVRRRLADWGAAPEVQKAGLCHATYGTDGFPKSQLPHDRRGALSALIGERAEAIVFLYGVCERRATYPRFGSDRPPGPGGPAGQDAPISIRDRFTGEEHAPETAQLRAFAEITAANELDIVAHNPEAAKRHGAGLARLLDRMSPLLSPAAVQAYTAELAAFRSR